MTKRQWLVAFGVFALLGACGLTNHTQLNDNPSSNLRIHVGQASSGFRTVAISSPEKLAGAQLCGVQNDKCISGQTFQLARSPKVGSNGRTLYVNERIPANIAGDVYFSAGNDYRRMVLGPAANGSGSWKSLFIAGDYQDKGQIVVAWDNARRDLAQLLSSRGFSPAQSRHLNRNPNDTNGIFGGADLQHVEGAFKDLQISNNDNCFLFMTSHGTKTEFYIEGARGINPKDFSRLLDTYCGERPTVAIVSACYAGIMINDDTMKPNRIIMTAADSIHKSNGCKPGPEYTFFDGCLVNSLKTQVSTWKQVGDATKACVDAKENDRNRSFPQFYYGSAVANLAIAGAQTQVQPNTPTPNNPPQPQPNNVVAKLTNEQNLSVSRPNQPAADLRTIAASKRYLIIDFSASWCGYCKEFVTDTLPTFAAKLGPQSSCKFMTIVDSDDYRGKWDTVVPATALEHTYLLEGAKIKDVLKHFGPEDGLPNIIQIDLSTGSVNQVEGNNVRAFTSMVSKCQ